MSIIPYNNNNNELQSLSGVFDMNPMAIIQTPVGNALTTLDGIPEALVEYGLDCLMAATKSFSLEALFDLIPTHTGYLADQLLQQSLYILQRRANGFLFTIQITPPPLRPAIISNPKHVQSLAWAKDPPSPLMYYSPLINLVKKTPKGGYYLRNDPMADGDYVSMIENYLEQLIDSVAHAMDDGSQWTAYLQIEYENVYVKGTYSPLKTRQIDVSDPSDISDILFGNDVLNDFYNELTQKKMFSPQMFGPYQLHGMQGAMWIQGGYGRLGEVWTFQRWRTKNYQWRFAANIGGWKIIR